MEFPPLVNQSPREYGSSRLSPTVDSQICYEIENLRFVFSSFSSFFFRRDALKEQFGKEPNRVSCLAVKSALLGTRHPRKEKEAALQNVTGEPACQYGKILMTTQSEMEPSIKIEEMKSVA